MSNGKYLTRATHPYSTVVRNKLERMWDRIRMLSLLAGRSWSSWWHAILYVFKNLLFSIWISEFSFRYLTLNHKLSHFYANFTKENTLGVVGNVRNARLVPFSNSRGLYCLKNEKTKVLINVVKHDRPNWRDQVSFVVNLRLFFLLHNMTQRPKFGSLIVCIKQVYGHIICHL